MNRTGTGPEPPEPEPLMNRSKSGSGSVYMNLNRRTAGSGPTRGQVYRIVQWISAFDFGSKGRGFDSVEK